MKQTACALFLTLLSCLVLFGCAAKDVSIHDDASEGGYASTSRPGDDKARSATPPSTGSDNDVLDDSAFDEANPISEDAIADPLESWNRMWFGFNDFLYINIFKPVYQGYEAVVPEALRAGLSNAFHNMQAPIRIVNSILQLEFAQAVVEFGRFIVNTTAGGLGLAEIVKPEDALVPINLASADFGGTLAKWGVGEGIYLVWPVIGPSTVRDTIGFAGDTAAGIPFWATEPIGPVSAVVGYSVTGGLRFNEVGSLLNNYEMLTKSAVEPYSSLRDAYVKLRRSAVLHARITW